MYDFSMFRTREADLMRAAEHRRLVREAEAGRARRKAHASRQEPDADADAEVEAEAPADEGAEGSGARDVTGSHGSSFDRAA